MNKGVVIALIGAGIGGIYLMKNKGSGMAFLKGKPVAKPPANSLGAKARVDTASQPWYNQGVTFLKSQVGTQVAALQKNPTATLQNYGSVIKSLSDVTGIFSMGSNDGSATPGDVSGPDDATAEADLARLGPITDMPASDVDQSDMIGSQLGGDAYDPSMYAGNDMGSSGDFGGDIGSSNADFDAA